MKKEGKGARNAPPASFIFLVDNVLSKDDDTNESKNQLLRTQKEFESIFKAAELRKYGEPVEHIMPEDYENIMVWALYWNNALLNTICSSWRAAGHKMSVAKKTKYSRETSRITETLKR